MNTQPSLITNEKPRLDQLDSLRGIASLGIMVFHTQGIHQLQLTGLFSFLVSQLGMGVPLFFILSSFSIKYSLQNVVFTTNNVQKYLLRRFFRIAPLYYVLMIAYIIFNYYEYHNLINIQEIFLNLVFLFSLSPIKYQGIVWAGWSIGIEFLMYFFLPILISIGTSIKKAVWLLVLCLIIAMVYGNEFITQSYKTSLYNYMNVLVMLPFFALGLLLFELYKRKDYLIKINNYWLLFLSISIAAVILVVNYKIKLLPPNIIAYLENYRLNFYSWSIPFSLIIIMQLQKPILLLHNKFWAFIGKISYSIYLLHPLLIFFLKGLFNIIYSYIHVPNVAFIACVFFTAIILLPLSFLVYTYIEVPGVTIGKKAIKKWNI